MTDLKVKNSTGSNANDGSIWTLAKATIAGAIAAMLAGDNIYLSQVHVDNITSTVFTFAGTLANPSKVICVNDGTETPTGLSSGAAINMTGAGAISMRGNIYVQGLALNIGAGSNAVQIFLNAGSNAPTSQRYENCDFSIVDTHPSSFIRIGSVTAGDTAITKLLNCRLKLASTSQTIELASTVHINGGSFISGSTTSANGVFVLGGSTKDTNVLIENFDFSNLSPSMNIFATPSGSKAGVVIIRNCKMPASWSGAVVAGAVPYPNVKIEMYNCDSVASNYKQDVELCEGSLKHETTIVRTGGASDGTTARSVKMTGSANANELVGWLGSALAPDWADTVGVAKTLTAYFVHDSLTPLTDADIWLELDYFGSSASPIGTKATGRRVSIFAAASSSNAFISDSNVAWTTTGLTNPYRQKLTLTFTPQMKGEFLPRVVLAKPKTIYLDPAYQVT